ncbi:MAG: hypothetical protein ACE37F_29130 [Nannocystaceae bacterium]|nr:hypothetical protein [bacterium]
MAEAPPEIAAAVLLGVRWFVILRVQPHWPVVLGRLWWPIALALGACVAVAASPAGVVLDSATGWATAIAGELLLGGGIGVVVSLPGYALLGATAASAGALRTAPGPLVRLAVSVSVVAALSLRLHHPALVVARDHADALPPGRPELWLPSVGPLMQSLPLHLDSMLLLALTLATPVLLSVFVLRAAVALVGSGPTVAKPLSEAVGPALATAGALLALAASWSVYPVGWARSAVGVAAG